jgi:hypothetical protein
MENQPGLARDEITSIRSELAGAREEIADLEARKADIKRARNELKEQVDIANERIRQLETRAPRQRYHISGYDDSDEDRRARGARSTHLHLTPRPLARLQSRCNHSCNNNLPTLTDSPPRGLPSVNISSPLHPKSELPYPLATSL